MLHPVKKYSFDALHKAYNDLVEKGFIIKKVKDDLELYCYSEKAIYEKCWNGFTRTARGIILCPSQSRIVALPFPKFFNVEENVDAVPNLPFETFEKLDGSLAIVYFWDGTWRCATKGSFNSTQAMYVEANLLPKLATNKMYENYTYLFEYVSPHNKVVVSYDTPELRFLSAIDRDSGEEIDTLSASIEAVRLKVACAKQFSYFSVEQVLDDAKTLPLSKEGYVLKFKNGLRLKAKGAEYCRVHKLISGLTPLSIWEAMFNGDDLEAYKKHLPEEFYKDFDAIYSSLQEKLKVIAYSVWNYYVSTKDLTDKELGLKLSTLPANIQPLIFNFRKNKQEAVHKEMLKQIRPKGNIL